MEMIVFEIELKILYNRFSFNGDNGCDNDNDDDDDDYDIFVFVVVGSGDNGGGVGLLWWRRWFSKRCLAAMFSRGNGDNDIKNPLIIISVPILITATIIPKI